MTNASNEETPKRTRRAAKTAASEAETEAPPPETSEPTLEEAIAVLRDPSGDGSTKVSHGFGDDIRPVGARREEWAAAAAEADAHATEQATSEWEWETSEEVLNIPLTPEDGLDLIRANGADEEAKASVDREVEDLKTELKEKKAESESISARMKERNRSGLKGVIAKKAHWKVGTCFALNTVRYVDPITERVVFERAIRADERQVALPLVSDDAADKAAQLSLGEADPSDLTDHDALLRAAQDGEDSAIAGEDDGDFGEEDDGDDEDSDL